MASSTVFAHGGAVRAFDIVGVYLELRHRSSAGCVGEYHVVVLLVCLGAVGTVSHVLYAPVEARMRTVVGHHAEQLSAGGVGPGMFHYGIARHTPVAASQRYAVNMGGSAGTG